MTTTVQRPPRNGVDVPTLFATLDAGEGFAGTRPVPVSGDVTNGSAVPTADPLIQGFYGAGHGRHDT